MLIINRESSSWIKVERTRESNWERYPVAKMLCVHIETLTHIILYYFIGAILESQMREVRALPLR